jgi:hypothetical protein
VPHEDASASGHNEQIYLQHSVSHRRPCMYTIMLFYQVLSNESKQRAAAPSNWNIIIAEEVPRTAGIMVQSTPGSQQKVRTAARMVQMTSMHNQYTAISPCRLHHCAYLRSTQTLNTMIAFEQPNTHVPCTATAVCGAATSMPRISCTQQHVTIITPAAAVASAADDDHDESRAAHGQALAR